MLLRIISEESFSSYVLNSERMEELTPADRALTTELVLGTLRWQKRLDWLIEQYAGRRVDQIDLNILVILRMALYQIKFLTKIPAHAAANEAVNLAKQNKLYKATGFINAVLRKAATDQEAERKIQALEDITERIAVETSHPEWIIRRWIERFGPKATTQIALANNNPPPISIRINLNRTSEAELKQKLSNEGIDFRESTYLPNCLLLSSAAVARSKLYKDGLFYFQDEASQMVPFLFGQSEGNVIADVCAAPGGKTVILSQRVGDSGRVASLDLHLSRQRLLQERLAWLGCHNVRVLVADATQPLPFTCLFDAVLADVPCSSLGTIRRNPEIKWKLNESDLDRFSVKQLAILHQSSAHVKNGGLLLYSTCSTEPEENENVVRNFLAGREDFRMVTPDVPESGLKFLTEPNVFRTFPVDTSLNGFFAVLLQKRPIQSPA